MLIFLVRYQGIAVGKYHAAILSNNEEWEDAVGQAGRAAGDMVFPVPFTPELHFSEFSSALADMKNSVAVSFSFIFLFFINESTFCTRAIENLVF